MDTKHMNDEDKERPTFPWANQPLHIRTLLTGLTLPIAAPVLMLLALIVTLMAAVFVFVIPFAYVIAGISPSKVDS